MGTFLFLPQQPATPTRTIAATPIQTLPQSQSTPKRIDTPSLEEPSDLEELEQFAKTFKQRRIKLGFTQVGGIHWNPSSVSLIVQVHGSGVASEEPGGPRPLVLCS